METASQNIPGTEAGQQTQVQQTPQQQQVAQGKTFTQEEVNTMMAAEKRQGKNSVLKELGLNPEDKDALKNLKTLLDGQKTDTQRLTDNLKAETEAKSAAEARALAAERKLMVLTSGCLPDFVEEVTALATAKTSDAVPFETALKQVREKCAAFFGEQGNGGSGTGQGQGHKRTPGNGGAGGLGARLAQSIVNQNQKNPYFD